MDEDKRESIEALFHPKTVAVIGATSERKFGRITFENLLKNRGGIRVIPVNPKAKEILGVKCYPSVKDIPEEVDLAVVIVPAKVVLQVVRECVEKKVKTVILISGGFSEVGPEGRKLEEQVVEAVRGSKTRILGPNTLGVFIPRNAVNTTFFPEERFVKPKDGSIAFISQSGASAIAFMEAATFYEVGFSAFVGLGNEADLTETDFIEYFAEDPNTGVICLYLEKISDGHRFLKVCREASLKKPIVVLKAGRTGRGARAALSHTGSLAGFDKVANGAFKQCGIVRAMDETELLDYAVALDFQKPPHGSRIAILTFGGGAGVIATDLIEASQHLEMAELPEEVKEELRGIVVPFASVNNPVDTTGNVTDEQVDRVLEVLYGTDEVDGILVIIGLQIIYMSVELADLLAKWAKRGGKPMVVIGLGMGLTLQVVRRLMNLGVPAYPTVRRGVNALEALAQRGKYLKRLEKVGMETSRRD
jgi:acetyl coenzyme A synthetase (ADP forming)-like protein